MLTLCSVVVEDACFWADEFIWDGQHHVPDTNELQQINDIVVIQCMFEKFNNTSYKNSKLNNMNEIYFNQVFVVNLILIQFTVINRTMYTYLLGLLGVVLTYLTCTMQGEFKEPYDEIAGQGCYCISRMLLHLKDAIAAQGCYCILGSSGMSYRNL